MADAFARGTAAAQRSAETGGRHQASRAVLSTGRSGAVRDLTRHAARFAEGEASDWELAAAGLEPGLRVVHQERGEAVPARAAADEEEARRTSCGYSPDRLGPSGGPRARPNGAG